MEINDNEVRALAKKEFDKTEFLNHSDNALIWSVWKRAFDAAWLVQSEFIPKSNLPTKYENNPDYEYEFFFKSEPMDSIRTDGWYPIETDCIVHPDRIPQHIENGILRKIKN